MLKISEGCRNFISSNSLFIWGICSNAINSWPLCLFIYEFNSWHFSLITCLYFWMNIGKGPYSFEFNFIFWSLICSLIVYNLMQKITWFLRLLQVPRNLSWLNSSNKELKSVFREEFLNENLKSNKIFVHFSRQMNAPQIVCVLRPVQNKLLFQLCLINLQR